jgi:L-aspartate oxidase
MKRHGLDCVFLDMTHKSPEFLERTLSRPSRPAACNWASTSPAEPIPVVPAAHYTCGGVVTDLAARTDLPGLYAIGETAFTGLHGANRLASNSLLECVVFSAAAAKDILAAPVTPLPHLPQWDESRVRDADEEIVISHNWAELRRFMWDYVGIVRTNKRLERACTASACCSGKSTSITPTIRVGNDLIELRNLVLTAHLIVKSAQFRHESRGLHFSQDYPETLPRALETVLHPRQP